MAVSGSDSGAVPVVGARVVTADGAELGKVKDVSLPCCFKVDAPLRPDYWLGADCIAEGSTSGMVRLTVTKAQLSEAKVASPGHEGTHGHEDEPPSVPRGLQARPLQTPEEQAQLRQRMEAELAAQRERLRGARTGDGAPGPA